MSKRTRILTLVASVAVIVVAFVALQPGGDSRSDVAPRPPKPPERPGGPNATTGPTGPKPAPDADPVVRRTVTVDANGPVGGVAEIEAKAGERIVVKVVSTGYSGEVHLHGFDVMRDVAPGKPAVFALSAAQTKDPKGQGSFELELEAIAAQIAKLRISP